MIYEELFNRTLWREATGFKEDTRLNWNESVYAQVATRAPDTIHISSGME